MSNKKKVVMLENDGWDERILAFQYPPIVTCHVVLTERFVVILDTLISPETATEMMVFLEPHLTADRQLIVVNTHTDWDHCWGNQIYSGPQATHPAPIIASQACCDHFLIPQASDNLEKMQTDNPGVFDSTMLTPPTMGFDGTMTIDGGDLTIQLFMADGHTHDLIAAYIPEIDTLFATDAAERPFPEARKPELMADMRRSLQLLAAYDAKTVLYCHSDSSTAEVIHENIGYFARLEDACRMALGSGVVLPDDEAIDLGALIDCPFSKVAPESCDLGKINDYYKVKGHSSNIRGIWTQISKG